ncbi:MAG TPA: acyltransferase [Archangium sp.]|jgi:hypothetical protein
MTHSLSRPALDGFFAGLDDFPIEFAFFYERLPTAEALAEGLARTLPAFPRLRVGDRVSLDDVPGSRVPSGDKDSRTGLFDSAERGTRWPRCQLKISRFGEGGCLGASMSHVLGDGVSLVNFLNAWARNVQGAAPVAPAVSECPPPPVEALGASGPLEEELARAGFRLGPLPRFCLREDYTWDILRLPREQVEALLREARASQPQVTVGDVLAAHLFRHYHPTAVEGAPEPSLGVIFDFRRIPGLLPASYFGNAGLPLLVPLAPGEATTLPLPALAARVRARLQSASAADFHRYHALLEEVRRTRGQEGLNRVAFSAEDHGLVINNISRFDLSLLDFGTGAPYVFDVITPVPRVCFIISRGDTLEAHTSLPKDS